MIKDRTSIDLPRVVITTTASVDGRITLSRDAILLQPGTAERWATMKPDGLDEVFRQRHDDHGAHVTIEGSGSFVEPGAHPVVLPGPRLPASDLLADWLPRRTPNWFIVADSRGRVDWTWGGDDETALVVLVCRATPLGYLQRLHDRGIGYLVAGDDRVDLREALGRVKQVFDADTVVADSGGTLNASLLRAGLVDELDLITLPGLVGGLGTPSMMDGPQLGPDDLPMRLELLSHQAHDGGVIRTRYRVHVGTRG